MFFQVANGKRLDLAAAAAAAASWGMMRDAKCTVARATLRAAFGAGSYVLRANESSCLLFETVQSQ